MQHFALPLLCAAFAIAGASDVVRATDAGPAGLFRFQTMQVATLPEVPACGDEVEAAADSMWQAVRNRLADGEPSSRPGWQYRARLFERVFGPDGHHVLEQTDSLVAGVSGLRVPSPDIEQLARSGYVATSNGDTPEYMVPDAATLLHPTFTATHCFQIAPAADPQDIKLVFEPTGTVNQPDISGTIWAEGSTHRLTRIEFRYAGVSAGGDPGAQGHLDFAQTETEVTFLRGWRLRVPTAAGFIEFGAEILEATDDVGGRVYLGENLTVLNGTVFDSTTNRPLPGGLVALAGTRHWSSTDAQGQFLMAGYFEGRYELLFGNPRLDSLGFISPRIPTTVTRGSQTTVDLAVPRLSTILAARCDGSALSAGRRMLHGVVRDGPTGHAVADALVFVSRKALPDQLRDFSDQQIDATALTDGLGSYAVCDVPVNEPIVVSAVAQDRNSDFFEVTFSEDSIRFGELDRYALSQPVARLDLQVIAAAGHESRVSGVVTDAVSYAPVPNATVQVDGTSVAATTTERGEFELVGVPRGPVRVTVRKLGFRMTTVRVDVGGRTNTTLQPGVLTLFPIDQAIVLDEIVVEGEGVVPRLSGFAEREARGFGSFVTREEFDRWNPALPTDVLRRMQGMRIRPNPYYGFGGDTRRWLVESSRDVGGRVTSVQNDRISEATAFGGGGGASTECPVLIFVDGVYMGDSGNTDIDNLVSTTNLAAVEAYSTSQVPGRFALPGSTCGVVVFWTR